MPPLSSPPASEQRARRGGGSVTHSTPSGVVERPHADAIPRDGDHICHPRQEPKHVRGIFVGELGSILAMQGFAGLILFSVFLLMALGLAIIFGQMGVINMAHGEFMILGAYMTYLCSHLVQDLRARPLHRLLLHRDGGGVHRLRRARARGRMAADTPPLRPPARHPARHLGPEPDHAAGVPLDLRGARSRRRAADLDDGLAQRHRHHRGPDQRPVRDGRSRSSSPGSWRSCCSARAGDSRCARWSPTAP